MPGRETLDIEDGGRDLPGVGGFAFAAELKVGRATDGTDIARFRPGVNFPGVTVEVLGVADGAGVVDREPASAERRMAAISWRQKKNWHYVLLLVP